MNNFQPPENIGQFIYGFSDHFPIIWSPLIMASNMDSGMIFNFNFYSFFLFSLFCIY